MHVSVENWQKIFIFELFMRCPGTGHPCLGIKLEISFNFVGITGIIISRIQWELIHLIDHEIGS